MKQVKTKQDFKTKQEVAKWLREARTKKGLTQQKLALMLRMNRSTISGYETGASEPSITDFNRMRDILL